MMILNLSLMLKHTVTIAQVFNSRIILLHVIPEIFIPSTMFAGTVFRSKKSEEVMSAKEYLKEIYMKMRLEAEKMLERQKKVYEDTHVQIETKVLI